MGRIATSQLEETVSMMVRSSQNKPYTIRKPCWWPRNLAFHYPLERGHNSEINKKNWRETLYSLISKCYKFYYPRRGVKQLRPRNSSTQLLRSLVLKTSSRNNNNSRKVSGVAMNIRRTTTSTSRPLKHISNGKKCNLIRVDQMRNMRRDSTGSSVKSTSSRFSETSSVESTSSKEKMVEEEELVEEEEEKGNKCLTICGGEIDVNTKQGVNNNNMTITENISLAPRNLTPQSPIVSICDVFHNYYQPTETAGNNDGTQICDNIKEKDSFMNYFELFDKNSSCKPDSIKQTTKVFTNSHPKHLLNCPHIPFSSDLGRKLIKDWPEINKDIFEKRLERTERYLQTNNLNPTTSNPEEFKISFNKTVDPETELTHFYTFPTKKRHRKNKLTPKARFLLEKYCKPCCIVITPLSDSQINEIKLKKDAILNNKPKQVKKTTCINQKENIIHTPFQIQESRVVLTDNIYKFKRTSPSNSLSRTDKNFPAKFVERSNFSLKTLSPRNENSVTPTIGIKKPVEPETIENFISSPLDPTVVLKPINHLLAFKTSTSSNVELKSQTRHPLRSGKIEKSRVNVYNPRRYPIRLLQPVKHLTIL